MYAVIETGGKQYRVEVGTELEVELLDVEPGKTVNFDRVLLVADGDTAAIGQPVVDGAAVSAEVLRQARGEKLISFKYRPKARSRVKKGHRQELTILRISDIVFGGKSAAKAAAKAESDAKSERQRLEEAAAAQAAKDAELAAKLAVPAKAATKASTKSTPAKATAKTTDKTDAPKSESKPETSADAKPAAKKTTPKAKATDAAASDAEAAPKKSAPKRATKKDE
jgi:large subunit ribosomal protein L21